MALSQDEIHAIAAATAESLTGKIDEKVDAQIGRRLKTKFELMFGANCEDEDARAEMRKDHEFLRTLRLGANEGAHKILYWVVGVFGTAAVTYFWPDIAKHLGK